MFTWQQKLGYPKVARHITGRNMCAGQSTVRCEDPRSITGLDASHSRRASPIHQREFPSWHSFCASLFFSSPCCCLCYCKWYCSCNSWLAGSMGCFWETDRESDKRLNDQIRWLSGFEEIGSRKTTLSLCSIAYCLTELHALLFVCSCGSTLFLIAISIIHRPASYPARVMFCRPLS